MKSDHISFVTVLAAAAVMTAQPAYAQTSTPGYSPDGVELFKNVVEGSEPNTYTINLEAFVTGESVKEEGILGPIDYSLILDTSGSMMEFVGYGYTALESRQYTYPELADGYTSLTDWKNATGPASYNISYNGGSWTGYATKYAIKVGTKYKHVLLCQGSGDYIAVAGYIGENNVSDIQSLSATGNKYSSFKSGKTPNIQLYQAAQSGSKLQLLKDAVSSFIDIVSAHAKENDLDHMVSIVRYNEDKKTNGTAITDYTGKDNAGAAVIRNFRLLNETGTTNADALKTGVNNLKATSQTFPYHGVDLVKAMYDGQSVGGTLVKDNDHQKIIILFSDGEPGSSGFNKSNANKTIDGLHTLKASYGATVFTIGVFDNVDDKCHQYMNAASQNYPDATTYEHAEKNGSADVSAHDYYKLVGTDSLSDIFEQIATETTSGGAGYKLEKTTTTVIDVVSPAFKLPDGADGSKITLQVAKCKGVQSTETDGSYVFTFYEPLTKEATKTLFPEIKAAVGVLEKTKVGDKTVVKFVEKEGGKAVSITGFGFSDNWVGPRTEGGVTSYAGYKLIISFPIEIDPSNPGGATESTNTEDSGIYTKENPDAPWEQIGGFEIPKVKIPNIIVIKNGLKKGDSAIFNVYKVEKDGTKSQFPIQLVATCKEDGKPAIAKTKIQKTGRYMVEETTWSWAYGISECQKDYPGYEDSSSITDKQWHEKGFGKEDETGYPATIPFKFGTDVTANSITRNVNDFTEQEEKGAYKGTLFIFSNESKTGTPAHAEANVNNVFYECN